MYVCMPSVALQLTELSLKKDTTGYYCRVATFSLSQSGTGVWGGDPSRRRSGVLPSENFWNSICDLVHFDAIWWQLYVGRRTRYICNFAMKIEPIRQLQCRHDCTAVLPLLSNERALKSGTFGVPGLVLLGRGITRHKSGTSREIRDGWQPYTTDRQWLNYPARGGESL